MSIFARASLRLAVLRNRRLKGRPPRPAFAMRQKALASITQKAPEPVTHTDAPGPWDDFARLDQA